jgi:hypothetical protein
VGSTSSVAIFGSSRRVCALSSMPSPVDTAKRALVSLLKALAARYDCPLTLTRDSSDSDVRKAFKKVCLKVHPDKPGGSVPDFQRLSAANDTWQDLLKNNGAPGRPPKAEQERKPRPRAGKPFAMTAPTARKEYSVRTLAVLLTYQGFPEDVVTVRLAAGSGSGV